MKIVSVCACTSGIAHTYIAKEKLIRAAESMGHTIKVETQGTIGTEDELTAEEIKEADVVILAVAGNAEVYVDLGAEHGADALGVQALVVLVGRDGDLALSDPLADLLGGAVFLFCHDLHLRRDDALAGGIHLGSISLHTLCSSK